MIDKIIKNNFTILTDKYEQFCREKDQCRKCSIYEDYCQNIQSEGNAKNPTFMFVGEAPGKEEQEQVRPFIGRAGQRLRLELRKWSSVFNKENTIITNILSCRPFENKFPNPETAYVYPNRTDSLNNEEDSIIVEDVVEYCKSLWLEREIELLKPKVIVALGSKALKYLFGDNKISENRGSWKFLMKYKAMGFATYHPSYVLRCSNDRSKFYNVKLFEQDIEKIAKTWDKVAASESRMYLTDELLEETRTRPNSLIYPFLEGLQ